MMALRHRSRASLTSLSASPTTENPETPIDTCASTPIT